MCIDYESAIVGAHAEAGTEQRSIAMIRTLVRVRAHTSPQEWHTLADADGLRQSHRAPGRGHQRAFPGPNLLPLPLRRDFPRRCSGAAPFLSHFPSRGAVHCMVAGPESRARRPTLTPPPPASNPGSTKRRPTDGRASARESFCCRLRAGRPRATGRTRHGRLYVSVLSFFPVLSDRCSVANSERKAGWLEMAHTCTK